MKGLLLKDWFMLKKYCRSYLLVLVIFGVVSIVDADSSFFIVYPMVLLGLLPVTLIAYDERSKWDIYCGVLPITRDQQVTGKYLMLLILAGAGLILTSLMQAMQMIRMGGFDLHEFILMEGVLISLGIIGPSVMLPVVYKYGSEKGRMMYFIIIIAICALSFSVDSLLENGADFAVRIIQAKSLPLLMIAAAVVIFVISWRLSVMFYRKREL